MAGSYRAPNVRAFRTWWGAVALFVLVWLSLAVESARRTGWSALGILFVAMGVAFVIHAARYYRKLTSGVLTRVDWDEQGVTLYPIHGRPFSARWQQTQVANTAGWPDAPTVERGPGLGISVRGRSGTYHVPITDTPECAALLDALKAHTGLLRPGETWTGDGG